MYEVFNSVLKGFRSLPITALVKLTFYSLNSYFVVRGEQCFNILASNEKYVPYVDVRLRHMWLSLVHLGLFFMITTKDNFISSQRAVEHIASTYMTIIALVVRHLHMDFHVVIL